MDLKEVPSGSFERHPWEISRAQFFTRELERATLLSTRRRVLDVGSGDGWLARQFAEAGPELEFVCWDVGYGGSAPPWQDRISYTAARPAGQFDLVLMLDVVEHVENDLGFVRDLARSMTPDAHLLFSVPAWPKLYSSHDAALGHFRRYTPDAARTLLGAAGMRIVRSGGLFHTLLPPRYLQVASERRATARRLDAQGKTGDTAAKPVGLAWNRGRVLRGCVQTVLDADNALSRMAANTGTELPGLSWWALCRRA